MVKGGDIFFWVESAGVNPQRSGPHRRGDVLEGDEGGEDRLLSAPVGHRVARGPRFFGLQGIKRNDDGVKRTGKKEKSSNPNNPTESL